MVHAELLSKKQRECLIFKKHELRALPMPEGFGVALRSSYLCSEPTCGAAPIEGIIMSRSSCRSWCCNKVGAPARSAALVPGIDCGADLVGQT